MNIRHQPQPLWVHDSMARAGLGPSLEGVHGSCPEGLWVLTRQILMIISTIYWTLTVHWILCTLLCSLSQLIPTKTYEVGGDIVPIYGWGN